MLSLLRLECKQKNYSNPFPIRIFLFLSYSFGIETINTFKHSVVPYKTKPDSRLERAKCLPLFKTKTAQKPYSMERHIAIWLIYGSIPRVFVITSGQIQIGTRLALILHAADQDLVLLPSLWLILPVVSLYWDFDMITSLQVSGVQIGECGVTSRCFSCSHVLAPSSKHATRWQTITPPPRPLPRKYSVVRRNPKLQLELSSKRSLKKNAAPYKREKKTVYVVFP